MLFHHQSRWSACRPGLPHCPLADRAQQPEDVPDCTMATLAIPPRVFGSLGRLPVEVLVRRVSLFAGPMDRAGDMLGWPVDRVESKRLRTSAYDIVARTLRHNDPVIGLHLVANAVDPDLTFASLDAEKLVTIVMDLFTNLLTGLTRH
jgi:hypothetical protein